MLLLEILKRLEELIYLGAILHPAVGLMEEADHPGLVDDERRDGRAALRIPHPIGFRELLMRPRKHRESELQGLGRPFGIPAIPQTGEG